MEKNGNERPKRTGAGVNESLSADFVWPRNFGGNTTTTATVPYPKGSLSADSVWTRNYGGNKNTTTTAPNPYESRQPDFVLQNNNFEGENTTTIVPNPVPSSNSKHSTRKSHSQRSSVLSLERKRLALEKEMKKQELEKQKRQLQFQYEQEEIENNIRLLNLEHELRNAELDAQDESDNVSARTNVFPLEVNQENGDNRNASVAEWVNNIQDDPFAKLCETITSAIERVSSPNQNNKNDIMAARNLMEKDFPYFDGNPQEWPLFHRQYQNICKLCNFSNEEIMIKLQRCLKGEAKSTVAGMMLTADNVDLVIETLEMRFGRPEFIIDGLIAKIRGLPFLKDSNFERLIQFSSEVHNMVAIMKTLKSLGHLKNPQLIKDLLNKLPDHLRLKWGEQMVKNNADLDLEDFSNWVGEVAKAACFVSNPNYPSTNKFGPKPDYHKRTERIFSTNEKASDIKCGYCEKKAHESDCKQMIEDDIDKRWKTVTEKKLCFSCLRKNHQKMKCRRKKQCGLNGCKLFHHHLLHKTEESQGILEPVTERNMVYAIRNDTKKVQSRVIPVILFGPNGQMQVFALCDEASTVTLIDETIAKKLGLSGTRESLCLQWTNEKTSMQEESMKIDVNISKPGGHKLFTMVGARTIKDLSLPLQNIRVKEWQKYQHLKNIPVNDIVDGKPVLLIGQDNIDLIIAHQIRCGPGNLPIASRCKLGWALHGPSRNHTNNEDILKANTLHICEIANSDDNLEDMVRNSFSTESFGVLLTPTRHSHEISRALKILDETTKYIGDRYETGLLWRSDEIELPESKFRALQRLKCVEKKCRLNESFGREYCEKIEAYEQKGYIRKLSQEEAKIEGPRTWYLPHFAVENANKKKIRLVFDAAAKSQGVSLNDVLLAGPDLLQSLVSILWKFRQRKFGFCGDVKEMFHQVRIREEDRDSQRFLWRNLECQRVPDIYEMVVMTFGATCSPVCAQHVKNLNAKRHASDPVIREAIIKKFYVDDYLDCKDTEEEAAATIAEVYRIQKLAGFEVVNWMTNSSYIQKSYPDNFLASKYIDDGSSLHRVLGLWWDTDNDVFQFKLNLKHDSAQMNLTKRMVLKSLMSLYDPLGLIASFAIRGKILMQDIWRSGIGWDEALPQNLLETWYQFVRDLPKITDIRIPRCYSLMIPTAKKIELHTFCDSSELAFAAVSYLRVMGEIHGKVDIALVASKTRVAPLKPLSIPKLELQAAVMASRLAQSIRSELEINIHQLYFWSDSKCVLSWIRNDGRKFKQFVAHRIGEIQERTNIGEWRWIPTNLNPADEATRRNCDERRKIISDVWFAGPEFLQEAESNWPVEEINSVENCNTEMKKEYLETCFVTSEPKNFLPNVDRFSSWLKLIRCTGWCLRFIKRTRKQIEHSHKELSVEELAEAEKIWIRPRG